MPANVTFFRNRVSAEVTQALQCHQGEVTGLVSTQRQTHVRGGPEKTGTCERPGEGRGRVRARGPRGSPGTAGTQQVLGEAGRVLAHGLQREHNPADTLTVASALAPRAVRIKFCFLQSQCVAPCRGSPGIGHGGNTQLARLVVVLGF